MTCGILVPRPGIEHGLMAVKVLSPTTGLVVLPTTGKSQL